VELVDSDGCESLLVQDGMEIGYETMENKLVLVGFDREFPGDDWRDENFIARVGNEAVGKLAERTRRIEPPKKRVRIEQYFHINRSSGLPSSIMMSKPYSRSSSSVSSGFHNSSG